MFKRMAGVRITGRATSIPRARPCVIKMSRVKRNRCQAEKKVSGCVLQKRNMRQGGSGASLIVLSHKINFSIKYKDL